MSDINKLFVTLGSKSSYSDLSNAIHDVANSLQVLAAANRNFTERVKGTPDCKYSTEGTRNVINANQDAARLLSQLNYDLAIATDKNGDLTELNPVIDRFLRVTDVIDGISNALVIIPSNFDRSAVFHSDDIVSSLEKINVRLGDITETFKKVTGPEELIVELSNCLNNLKEAFHELYSSISQLIDSMQSDELDKNELDKN